MFKKLYYNWKIKKTSNYRLDSTKKILPKKYSLFRLLDLLALTLPLFANFQNNINKISDKIIQNFTIDKKNNRQRTTFKLHKENVKYYTVKNK